MGQTTSLVNLEGFVSQVATELQEFRRSHSLPKPEDVCGITAAVCRYHAALKSLQKCIKEEFVPAEIIESFSFDEHKATLRKIRKSIVKKRRDDSFKRTTVAMNEAFESVAHKIIDQNKWLQETKNDITIVEPEGRLFWLGNFGQTEDIEWSAFWLAFKQYMGTVYGFLMELNFGGVPGFKYTNIEEGVKSCMALNPRTPEIVTMKDFREFYERYGPWPDLYRKSLTLCDLSGLPLDWFLPNASSEAVEELFRNPKYNAQIFFLRYSDTSGCLVRQTRKSETLIKNSATGYIIKCFPKTFEDIPSALRRVWNSKLKLYSCEDKWKQVLDFLDLEPGEFYAGLDSFVQQNTNENDYKRSSMDPTAALMHAAQFGDHECMWQLIVKKANLESNYYEPTALMEAAWYGKLECMKVLISAKANLETSRPIRGQRGTALFYAACGRKLDSMKLLISSKASVGVPPLSHHFAAGYKPQREDSALILCAYLGLEEPAKLLISSNADIEAKGKDGESALMRSVTGGQSGCTKLLIDSAADIEAKREGGDTALIHSANCEQGECMEVLISSKANINAQGQCGTAIMTSIINSGGRCIWRLIASKADMEVKNQNGSTALMCAVRSELSFCISVLLNAGANALHPDAYGIFPVDVSRRRYGIRNSCTLILFQQTCTQMANVLNETQPTVPTDVISVLITFMFGNEIVW